MTRASRFTVAVEETVWKVRAEFDSMFRWEYEDGREALAPTYEKRFSIYGDDRPWRAGLLRNIEPTYAKVS